MKNGTQKALITKTTKAKQKLSIKPVFVAQRPRKNGLLVAADAVAYGEYLTQLRDWLYALPDEQFDRELRKLSRTDLSNLNWKNTYDAHHNGDQMHETA